MVVRSRSGAGLPTVGALVTSDSFVSGGSVGLGGRRRTRRTTGTGVCRPLSQAARRGAGAFLRRHRAAPTCHQSSPGERSPGERSPGQAGVVGRSSTNVPGEVAVSSRPRAAAVTSRCRRRAPGGPSVRPMRWGVTSVRGSVIASATWRKARMNTATDGRPASSNARATCPTDTWHTGQVATSRQTSTPSATSSCAQRGATSLRSSSCDAAPTKP